MVPENRKVEVTDKRAIGGIGKDVIHASWFELLIQCCSIGTKNAEMARAVKFCRLGKGFLAIAFEEEHFLLGADDVAKAALKGLPNRQFHKRRRNLIAVDAEDA